MFPIKNLEKYKLVLCSNSPRRRELLADMGLDFEVRVLKGVDESYDASMPGHQVPVYLSQLKARAHKTLLADGELLIAADTVVLLDNEILGKPADEAHACRMLRELSGRKHEVVTGVTIATKDFEHSFSDCARVEFAELTDDEISYYVQNYRPLDKAGAYGIQEWIGCIGVKSIEGSFYNVMGLPVQRLYEAFKLLP